MYSQQPQDKPRSPFESSVLRDLEYEDGGLLEENERLNLKNEALNKRVKQLEDENQRYKDEVERLKFENN